MKSNYTHLTIFDRQTIEIQLKRWTTQKEIAEILWKNKSTISREIKLNSIIKKWKKWKEYLASDVKNKAYIRRYYSKKESMKINMNSEMRIFIICNLKRKNILPSPKIVAALWNNTQTEKKKHITHTSIYSWLETGMWNKYKELLLYKYKWYKRIKVKKWSIENLNRIIRRFFPKWTNFGDISEKQIKNACDIIADTPRKILDYVSPNQAHFPII